jgi:hypothetical protein
MKRKTLKTYIQGDDLPHFICAWCMKCVSCKQCKCNKRNEQLNEHIFKDRLEK